MSQAVPKREAVYLHDEVRITEQWTLELKPGFQSIDWKYRWTTAKARVAKLGLPLEGEVTGKSINDARDDLLELFVWMFHIKDALKVEAAPLGFKANVVEDALSANPTLCFLGDMANLIKHHGKSRSPRSGFQPRIGEPRAVSIGHGWSLGLTIYRGEESLDAVGFAKEAVAAWEQVLSGLGLAVAA